MFGKNRVPFFDKRRNLGGRRESSVQVNDVNANTGLLAMFEEDRPWLRRQPRMTRWKKGCHMLVARMEQWLREYSPLFCDEEIAAGHRDYGNHMRRLWNCWRHHWSQAVDDADGTPVDGQEVASRIRQGRGFLRGGDLGGDPLRDVVLAQAALTGQDRALAHLHENFRAFAVGMAIKTNAKIAQHPDDWWNEFIEELAGFTDRAAKLDRFHGKCGLRSWLGTVVRNAVRPRGPRRKKPTQQPATDVTAPADGRSPETASEGLRAGSTRYRAPSPARAGRLPEDPVDRRSQRQMPPPVSSAELLGRLIEDVLPRMSARHRVLLYLQFVEEVEGNRIARVVGVDSGHASRLLRQAAGKVRELLLERAEEIRAGSRYGAMVVDLIRPGHGSQRLGSPLMQGLKKHKNTVIQWIRDAWIPGAPGKRTDGLPSGKATAEPDEHFRKRLEVLLNQGKLKTLADALYQALTASEPRKGKKLGKEEASR